jgi:hemerythrin-like domain-containing protein
MLDRRRFLSYIPIAATTFGVMAGLAPGSKAAKTKDQGVGAIETLMRGHGLLLRAMIIYGVVRDRIGKGEETEPSFIFDTSATIHNYLEGFHEMAEEKYIFAPLEKDKAQFSAIQELKVQHGTGYELTSRISSLSKAGKLKTELAGYLDDFVKMYSHHAAYEDTVIFPAFDALKQPTELAELVVTFDAEEKRVLGNHGFDDFLNQIASVEKKLGIYELSSSTPKLK